MEEEADDCMPRREKQKGMKRAFTDPNALPSMEELGWGKLYRHKGIGLIFYNSTPSSEALAYVDVSNSSRINPKEEEMLIDRAVAKSAKILGQKNAGENEIKGVVRDHLDKVANVLGSRNISEQAHVMMQVALPINSVIKIHDETFIASQERSTRYVPFNEVHVPEEIGRDPKALAIYTDAMEGLRGCYYVLLTKSISHLVSSFKRSNNREPTPDEIKNRIVPSARDNVRGFIPVGAMTLLSLSVNMKAAQNITKKLSASPNSIDRDVAHAIMTALAENVPSLSKHLGSDGFDEQAAKHARRSERELSNGNIDVRNAVQNAVRILKGSQSEEQMVDSIYGAMPKPMLPEEFNNDRRWRVLNYIEEATGAREGKWHDLNETHLRSTFLEAEIECSLGTMRDLERHRLSVRNYTIRRSSFVLPDMIMADREMHEIAVRGLVDANNSAIELEELGYDSEAELLTPLACAATLSMGMSLAEALFIIENRSTSEAHPEYKMISHALLRSLGEQYPQILSKVKKFVGDSGALQELSRTGKEGTEEANRMLY